MKLLRATHFGNPVLRQTARRLTVNEILSKPIQELIGDMQHTLVERKYGVGLAAPQVGEDVALSVVGIKSTPLRPDQEPYDLVIINPEIVEMFGQKTQLWEGCISCGTGNNTLFAKVPRYKKIRLHWQDEAGKQHKETFDSFVAHVIQHEVDHLNGVLFVDRVEDTSSYMMAAEYRKRIVIPQMKASKLSRDTAP